MNSSKKGHSHKRKGVRSGARLKSASAGALLVFALPGGAAFAQQAPQQVAAADELAPIEVTGIRASIERAINMKRDSDGIIESITAEDIGKLPDVSIAESIARLPGVTAQRVDGRAQYINFRGMSPDFAGTTLNGREQVSTGDNRGVEFDQYPAELINQVVVYKTMDVSLVGQGISGTADLRTVRPLEYGKRAFVADARYEKNSLGELNSGISPHGYRTDITYIDQSANKKIGWALGYARLKSPGEANRWEAWGYTGLSGYPGSTILGGGKQYVDSTENTRDGFMGALEIKPDDHWTHMLDLYYSKFDQKIRRNGMEFGTAFSGAHLSGTPTIDGSGFVTNSTWVGVKPVLVNREEPRNDKVTAIGWNSKFHQDAWTYTGDVSYSRATDKQTLLETYAGTVGTTDTVTMQMNGANAPPSFNFGLNYADPNLIKLNDSGGWGQDGYVKYPNVTDTLKALRFDVSRSMEGMFSSVDAGVNYSEREKDKGTNEYKLALNASPTSVAGIALPASNLGFVGVPGIIAYDGLAAQGSLYHQNPFPYFDIYAKAWNVKEKITTAYVKANIDTKLWDNPLRGNLGLQMHHADQSSTALAANAGAPGGLDPNPVPTSGGAKYTYLLPSLNLAETLPDENIVRFGLSRQLARPRLDQEGAYNSYNYSVNTGQLIWGGTGGNPSLKPWISNSLDLSWEKYFGNKGYVALAGFFKKLQTYVLDSGVYRDFSGFPVPINPATGQPWQVLSNQGLVTGPINGNGGFIKGLEFTASIPFNLLTKSLDGFGVEYTHSINSSNIVDPVDRGACGCSDLPGLSRQVENVTGYYEQGGFSARISQRHRSAFLGEIAGFANVRTPVYILGESIIDAQVSYEMKDGQFKGLSVLGQVLNLNDEPYRTQAGDSTSQLNQYTKYGRTYLFGIKYKL